MMKKATTKKYVKVRHRAFRRAVEYMDDALQGAERDFDNTELIEALGQHMFGEDWRPKNKPKPEGLDQSAGSGVREWGT